jgi:uncharacterized protein involved in outer membrane biogenesis
LSRRGRLVRAAFVIAGLVIAIIIAVRWIPFDRHRRVIEARLSQAIGLEARIGGELHLGLFPNPRLEATGVTVANLPGRPSPHLLEIGRLALTLDSWRALFGDIEVEGLEIEDAEIRIETDAEGRFGLRHHLESLVGEPETESSGRPVAFEIRRLAFSELRVFHHPGDEGAVTSLRFEALDLEADDVDDSIALDVRGELDGSPIVLSGSLGSLSELLAPTRPYPASLRGRVFEAEIEMEGTVEEPATLRGIDVSISALLPDLTALAPDHPQKLALLGPVRITGQVKKPDDVISVEELVVASQGDPAVRAEVRGSVGDLRAFTGVALDLRLEAEDLEFLEPFVDRPLPEIASLTAQASVADRDGSLGIEGRLRAVAPEERIALELMGGQDDLSRIDDVDLRFELLARNLAVIGEALALERTLPDAGPVSASGRLRDHDGALGVEELVAQVGRREDTWTEIEGRVDDLFGLRGVRLSGRFGAQDLDDVAPYLTYRPPDIGPIRGSANLSDADGSLGLERFRLFGGRKGSFEVALTGDFDDLRDLDEITLQVKLEARDLAVIGGLFDTALPAIGPVEFSGRLTGSDERVVAADARARLDKTRFAGDLSGSFVPGKRPSLRGRVRSPHIYLDDIGIEPRAVDAAKTARAAASGATRRARTADDPLPFEQLRALDLELDLRADRVTGRADLEIEGLETSIHLDDGELSIREAAGMIDAGSVQAELRIDARTPTPLLALRGQASGVDLTRLALQIDEETETAGLLDASFDLRSRGSTPAELRRAFEGEFRAVLREGTLTNRYARKFMVNLLRVSIPSLPLFRFAERTPKVSCLVAEFEIEDGVATAETFFLDAPGAVVTAVGEVDLGRDQIDLRVTPRPRDPGLLSVAVAVDVSGPLASPSYTPVPRTIATSLVEGLVSNAMRPARFLLSPLQRGAAEAEDPCTVSPDPGAATGSGGESPSP